MAVSIPCVKISNTISRIKVLLNDMPTAVDDALKGFVMANKGLVLLEDDRIVMRRDQANIRGKVKLLSGGGAGHEPAHVGFIGPGMLTAVVIGTVFKPPPANTILKALRELGRNHPEGILIIIPNYTSNRFNFGSAMEKARNEGNNIKMLVVGDDCLISSVENNQERRGLAGVIFIEKLAGAMSEEGKTLEEIFAACRSASMSDMGTLGVGVKLQTSFSKLSRFSLLLKEKELELGLGVSNEPGTQKIPLTSTAETVQFIIEYMLNPMSKSHFQVSHSCPLAVLINNLGGNSKFEEYIFVMEVIKQLDNRGHKVERFYHGCFVSSLESAGYSITLLKVNSPEILKYLDAPTSAPAWPRTLCASCVDIDITGSLPISVPSLFPHDDEELRYLKLQIGPKMSDKSARSVNQVIQFATNALASCEYQLNQFDAEVSDGDTGSVMKGGAMAIKEALQTGALLVKRPYAMLEEMSSILESSVGGSSAGLYSVFFSAAAKPFSKGEETDPIDAHLWLEALRSGTEAVMLYGRAEVGDRSMVDALYSAVNALERGLKENPSDELGALRMAAEAAQEATEQTIGLKACVGQASKTKRDNPLAMPDPGAAAVGIWLRALYEGCRLSF